MSIKINNDLLENGWFEEGFELDGENFELIDEGGWIHDHKCQQKFVVFKNENSECFGGYISRSGSEFTDWIYDSEVMPEKVDLLRVERVEVKTYEWQFKE